MPDQSISQVYNTTGNSQLLPPASYLVMLDGVKKGSNYLIALRLEEHNNNYLKVIGFYTRETYEAIIKSHREIIKETSPESVIEIMVPWCRVKSVQSLIYKFKGNK